jgi:hypothetical protein
MQEMPYFIVFVKFISPTVCPLIAVKFALALNWSRDATSREAGRVILAYCNALAGGIRIDQCSTNATTPLSQNKTPSEVDPAFHFFSTVQSQDIGD